MGEELAVGFRFYPTEVELISFYLRTQLNGGNATIHSLIPILNVFSFEPTQLPNLAGEKCRGDEEQWFFFVPRQEREARGGRPSRTTGTGYWKATGSPSPVFSPDNRVIGVKKTMVFYTGKAPTGKKSKWKMNEYKAVDETARPTISTTPQLKAEFSLCRIYVKSGSSRAFDRRPTNKVQRELRSNGVAISSRVNMSASPETSCSEGDKLNLPVNANVPTNTQNISSEMVDELLQPCWDWEQVNWSNMIQYLEVEMTTNCTDVLKLLSYPNEWPAFQLYQEEFLRLKSLFRAFTLHVIPRSLNHKADALARSIRESANSLVL